MVCGAGSEERAASDFEPVLVRERADLAETLDDRAGVAQRPQPSLERLDPGPDDPAVVADPDDLRADHHDVSVGGVPPAEERAPHPPVRGLNTAVCPTR